MNLIRAKFRMMLVKYLARLTLVELNCLLHDTNYIKNDLKSLKQKSLSTETNY